MKNKVQDMLDKRNVDNSGFYSTSELAKRINVSVRYVEEHREQIVGATRFGRLWRFDKRLIESRLAVGKDILI